MGLAELFLGSTNPIAQFIGANSNKIHGAFAGFGTQPGLGGGLAQAALYANQGGQIDDANAQRIAEDKARQDQIAKEIDYLRSSNPKLAEMVAAGMDPNAAFTALLDSMKPKEPAAGFSLSPGEARFDAEGHQIASIPTLPDKPKEPPTGYRYGADGTTLEFIPGGPADPSTAGKTTEATRRNQQLATVIEPEVKSLIGDATTPGTFDALANGVDQAKSFIPGGNLTPLTATSPEYQQATDSLRTIVASYLYSVSGATANPGEVQTQVDILTPKPGDSKERVAAKKARVQQMVDAVRAAATGKQINIDGPAPAPSGGVVDYRTYFGTP